MRVKCYHADRVQCSFQCTGVNNRKEPGTQRGLSGLPFFLLIYCGVVNKPLHLSASISLSVNSNHSNPFLKRVWRISLLSIKMLSEKKKTNVFKWQKYKQGGKPVLGVSGWLPGLILRQPSSLFFSMEEESVLSLPKNIQLASSTINLACAAPCSQYFSTDVQRIKTDKIKEV